MLAAARQAPGKGHWHIIRIAHLPLAITARAIGTEGNQAQSPQGRRCRGLGRRATPACTDSDIMRRPVHSDDCRIRARYRPGSEEDTAVCWSNQLTRLARANNSPAESHGHIVRIGHAPDAIFGRGIGAHSSQTQPPWDPCDRWICLHSSRKRNRGRQIGILLRCGGPCLGGRGGGRLHRHRCRVFSRSSGIALLWSWGIGSRRIRGRKRRINGYWSGIGCSGRILAEPGVGLRWRGERREKGGPQKASSDQENPQDRLGWTIGRHRKSLLGAPQSTAEKRSPVRHCTCSISGHSQYADDPADIHLRCTNPLGSAEGDFWARQ